MDTVQFDADGRIRGTTGHVASPDSAATRWHIGEPMNPDALCVDGDSIPATRSHWVCQAFLIKGDTLWLANGAHSTHLKLSSGRDSIPIAPWQTPHGAALSVEPGGHPKFSVDTSV